MDSITDVVKSVSLKTGVPPPFIYGAGALLALLATRTAVRALTPPKKLKNGSSFKVMITGCDTGFGNALAIQLSERGFTVFAACLTDKGIEGLQSLATTQTKYKGLRPFKLDVTKDADVAACRALLEKECHEGLYCLINNAGIHAAYKWELSSMDAVTKDVNVNYLGVVRTTIALLPLLRKFVATRKAKPSLPKPRVVIITSIAGIIKASPLGSYMASKHAAQVFGVTLRQEIVSQGIEVALIEPWYARTPLVTALDERKIAQATSHPPEILDAYGGKTAIAKRMSRNAFHTPVNNILDPQTVVDTVINQVMLFRPNVHNLVGTDAKIVGFVSNVLSQEAWDATVVKNDNAGM
ncbi:NAD(P)-binding protein [Gonapodya prolifera JEL478]|uniref:NAD(P)-binding protein n=1 Tax=Gonapodya prolifera (strain JEL478) TaxID=1344416 RepID=A0A139AW39_GONPJ|nr:NAD(P)-binding protein [Gonapodya prolifera JEL478]|eukprot:KXS20927.1 NAD(P)-binding protein [Gonapodya prolifera JEL478]